MIRGNRPLPEVNNGVRYVTCACGRSFPVQPQRTGKTKCSRCGRVVTVNR